jgi:chromate reductase, NAD(P)H dehydrogenase (quinone)
MKILTFAGSLRKDSFNKRISRFACNYIDSQKLAEIKYMDLQPLQIPVYDGDLEVASGLPEGVQKICAEIESAQALIISTPEYNGSIPGVLKNTIDWISRQKPQPLARKHILLVAASPGALGGIRSLWHTRQPFEVLGCHVYPEMLSFPKVHELTTSENSITDEKVRTHFERLLKDFTTFVK